MGQTQDYPKLSEVRKSLRVKWYRCPIDTKVLHALLKRSDRQGFVQAGGHLSLWLLTGALVYICWLLQLWWLLVPVVLVHGTVSSFFVGVAPHELGHGTVFRTPALNRFFLYLFSLISWWDPFDYASSHTYHHRYTLHPSGDREVLLPMPPNTSKGFLFQLMTINLLTPQGKNFGKGGFISTVVATIRGAYGKVGSCDIPSNEWLEALHRDQVAEFKKSITWSRILLIFHTSVVIISVISGNWIIIFIITLAPFIANLMSYLVGMTQHSGLKDNEPDFRKCTRSIVLNPLLEFLYWRMNWHTEHHMFAGVPCYNLKKLHQHVRADMPVPRTLREAWREMLDTWKKQQENPAYYFDTPLPVSERNKENHSATGLEASIGDLAPRGLRD